MVNDNTYITHSRKIYTYKIFSCLIIYALFLPINLYSRGYFFKAGMYCGIDKYNIKGEIYDFWNANDGIGANVGTTAGLYIRRSINWKTYWTIKIQYTRKGSIHALPSIYGTPNYERLKLDYLEIPVMYGTDITFYDKRCILEAGIGAGRLTRLTLFIDEYDSFMNIEDEELFRKMDVCWLANLIIPAGRKEKFSYYIRFSQSMLSIHKKYKLKNFYYSVGFDYLF